MNYYGGLSGSTNWQERTWSNNMSEQFTSCKYATIISIYLYEYRHNESVSHTEIYEALGISKNNLTNIIKRLLPTGLLEIEKEGRNKYYRLSNLGIEFYNSLLEKENSHYYQRAKLQIKNNL